MLKSFNKIPLVLLTIWISLIVFFTWQRVNQSDRPPLWDALDYFKKSKFFWENAAQGLPVNPFNLPIVQRPPGIVLMAYPLGFNPDYHGFLFRSVVIPFLLWILSILLMVWPTRIEHKKNSYWRVLLYVSLLGPIPCFFQLDHGDAYGYGYWGMVDTFLASMAALSIALVIKSIEKGSGKWLVAAVIVGAICPLIKPAGYFLFMLVGFFWVVMAFACLMDNNNQNKKKSIRYLWFGATLFFITGMTDLYLGFSSAYLGKNTFAMFSRALSVLNNETKSETHFSTAISMSYYLLGPQFLIGFLLFVFLVFRKASNFYSHNLNRIFLISGILFILIGIWFWIQMSGISEIRYFYPFVLMGFIPFVYCSIRNITNSVIQITQYNQWVINLACLLPAMNFLFLMSQLNPNKKWQNISGYDLYISTEDEGVKFSKKFITHLENSKTMALVYATYTEETGSFYSYGRYYKIIHPDVKGFNCIFQFDWNRPHGNRIYEILLQSNYIIYNYLDTEQQLKLLHNSADIIPPSWYQEGALIEAFLNTLTPQQGLQTVLEGKKCKLSEITDKLKLKQAFETFLLSRKWSSQFLEENKLTPLGWNLFDTPFEESSLGYIRDTSTLYTGYIVVNEVYPAPDTTYTNFSFSFSGWLAYDANNGINADKIFVALTYPDGTLKYWPTSPVSRPDVSKAYSQPSLIASGFLSLIDVGEQKGSYTAELVFVYKGKLIHCDSLKRIIISN